MKQYILVYKHKKTTIQIVVDMMEVLKFSNVREYLEFKINEITNGSVDRYHEYIKLIKYNYKFFYFFMKKTKQYYDIDRKEITNYFLLFPGDHAQIGPWKLLYSSYIDSKKNPEISYESNLLKIINFAKFAREIITAKYGYKPLFLRKGRIHEKE